MVHIAKELLPKLRHLVLAGQDKDGQLVWIGTDKEWKTAKLEEQLADL